MSKKVDPEKKREYNKVQRAKAREKQQQEVIDEKVIEVEPEPEPEPEQVEDNDNVVMDKKTYDFLIQQAKKAQIMQQVKPVEQIQQQPIQPIVQQPIQQPVQQVQQQDTFFFLVQKQLKSTLASLVPILVIQGAIHGAQFLKNSSKNITYLNTPNPSSDTMSMFVPRAVGLQ